MTLHIKHKKVLAAFFVLAILVCTAIGVFILHQGKFEKETGHTESVSHFSSEKTFEDALKYSGIINVKLPEKYRNLTTSSEMVSESKLFLSITLINGDTEITVTKYNYTYIAEDSPRHRISPNAEKVSVGNNDIFISEENGMTVAQYYVSDTEYYITDNCTETEMKNIISTVK